MAKKEQTVKLKKAPGAPRRFKSAYMFFSTEKHKAIREENNDGSLQTTDVAKMVSQAWKNLSSEERERWEEMARRDKARYEMEKSMYTGPWKVPANQKKPRRDPAAPKRPMSAFLSYSNSKRAKVKVDNPDISNADISRILARMWKEAPEEERKIHIEKEYALRQSYKKAIAEWRKNADQEAQAARQKREDIALKRLEDPNSHATEMRSNADIQLSIEVAEHELQRDQRRQDPPLTATSKDDPLPYQPHGLDELHHHHHQQLYSTTVNQEPGRAGSDPANSLASMTFSPVTVYGMGVADVSSSMPYTPQAFGQFGQSIGLSQMSVNDSSFDVPGMMPNGYGLPQPPMMNVFDYQQQQQQQGGFDPSLMQAGYYNGHYPLHGGTSWNNPQCFDGGASNGNIQQSGGSGRMQQQPEGFFDEQPF